MSFVYLRTIKPSVYVVSSVVNPNERFVIKAELLTRWVVYTYELHRGLQHPGVIPLLHAWTSDIRPAWFPISEHLPAGVLFYTVYPYHHPYSPGGHKLTREDACELVETLAYLQRCGIYHNDLKPDNVVFKETGLKDRPYRPVLIDFGHSERVERLTYNERHPPLTRPPEYRVVPTQPTPQGDLWALGQTLWYLTKDENTDPSKPVPVGAEVMGMLIVDPTQRPTPIQYAVTLGLAPLGLVPTRPWPYPCRLNPNREVHMTFLIDATAMVRPYDALVAISVYDLLPPMLQENFDVLRVIGWLCRSYPTHPPSGVIPGALQLLLPYYCMPQVYSGVMDELTVDRYCKLAVTGELTKMSYSALQIALAAGPATPADSEQ